MEQLFHSEGNAGETSNTFGHNEGTAYFGAGVVFQSDVGGSSA
jgi:hypothetical protein